MKYNLGDELWSANYEICQTDADVFVLDYFAERVHIEKIEIAKFYSDRDSNITYRVSNGQHFRENENPRELGLFLNEEEARKSAKEKAIMAGKLEISNYESVIKDRQKRIKELKQSIKNLTPKGEQLDKLIKERDKSQNKI